VLLCYELIASAPLRHAAEAIPGTTHSVLATYHVSITTLDRTTSNNVAAMSVIGPGESNSTVATPIPTQTTSSSPTPTQTGSNPTPTPTQTSSNPTPMPCTPPLAQITSPGNNSTYYTYQSIPFMATYSGGCGPISSSDTIWQAFNIHTGAETSMGRGDSVAYSLPAASYEIHFTVTDPTTENQDSPYVDITVLPPPAPDLAITNGNQNYVQACADYPPPYPIVLENEGNVSVQWQFEPAGSNWATANPAANTLLPGDTETVSITPSPAIIEGDVYSATLALSFPQGGSEAPITLNYHFCPD
jgi:hypothetical protein